MVLENETPPILSQAFNIITGFLETYGWPLLFFVVVLNLVWTSLRPKLQKWRNRREEQRIEEQYRQNPERLISIQEGLLASRQRFQEQHDQLAVAQAEKMKQLKEEKTKEKVKLWDSIQKGASNKTEDKSAEMSTRPKPVEKKTRLRGSDYNPLMGASSGTCFRPSRRGGGAGG